MNQKYLKNSISALLIISFILMPLSAMPKKAQAQTLGGYVQGLVPAIAQLPLCKGKLTGATKYLFGQASGAAAQAAGLAAKVGSEKATEILNDQVQEAQSQLDKIGVYDAEANKKIIKLQQQLNAIQASTDSIDTNDTCLKNIGRLVIKMLLQKLTLSTVNWINSGFDGKPAFIQDPGKFFEDIAKNEILQFGLEINNPELFPFGKAWLQNQAIAFNNKFTDNARYSLDEMIRNTTPQFSAQAFQLDFSQGGWNAWSAMTQYPQNNPLGFQLMASDELQRRLEGTQQSVASNVRDALEAADGFLGDQRCAEPEGLTRQQHEGGLIARSGGDATAPICERWEYVTPGKLIAEAATSTMKYPENNLLKADDLNDAVAAILDALLSRFSSDIMEKGYAYFSDEGADGTFVFNQDAVREDFTNQAEKDFSPVHLTSSWLSTNLNFNIRTDLTTALIDEQRTYADKLTLQNKELNSTTDGRDYEMSTSGISNAYGLIPSIAQLDYCIPGPHPGWEEDSRRVLDAVTNKIIPETVNSVGNRNMDELGAAVKAVVMMGAVAGGAAIGASIGSVVPVVGTIIGAFVGAVVGAAVNFISGLLGLGGPDNTEKIRFYYASIIGALVGTRPDYDDGNIRNSSMMSKQGAVQVLNVILERYIDIMHLVYSPRVLPEIHKEAATEFYKLKGYAQILMNNEDAISATNNTVNTLGEIKDAIDDLNARFPDGGDTYENELKPHISAFGRLSANMVNGDDIANADNILKQIIDEQKYVYRDLLKGQYGCEQSLAQTGVSGLPPHLHATTRMNYPFPILYTYNMSAGGNIPDPFPEISGLEIPNRTNLAATHSLGPGFLSFYGFQTDLNASDSSMRCVADTTTGVVPYCQLKVTDLYAMNPPNQNPPINLGAIESPNRSITILGKTISIPTGAGGPFEHTIGVY